ncbi:MAG: hypothetical protein JWO47_931 [Candidatus Saccharibacteria bacterium]|nr:hypothetical protein [Candidatus Saccharibacteria bacterium]
MLSAERLTKTPGLNLLHFNQMKKSSVAYYGGRVAQRLALCMVVGATIIHWIILITITANTRFISVLQNNKFKDSQDVNNAISRVTNLQSLIVLRWFIFATLITFVLLLIRRYRKYEKAMIVDSLVITTFCMLSVIFAQAIIRVFITRL